MIPCNGNDRWPEHPLMKRAVLSLHTRYRWGNDGEVNRKSERNYYNLPSVLDTMVTIVIDAR